MQIESRVPVEELIGAVRHVVNLRGRGHISLDDFSVYKTAFERLRVIDSLAPKALYAVYSSVWDHGPDSREDAEDIIAFVEAIGPLDDEDVQVILGSFLIDGPLSVGCYWAVLALGGLPRADAAEDLLAVTMDRRYYGEVVDIARGLLTDLEDLVPLRETLEFWLRIAEPERSEWLAEEIARRADPELRDLLAWITTFDVPVEDTDAYSRVRFWGAVGLALLDDARGVEVLLSAVDQREEDLERNDDEEELRADQVAAVRALGHCLSHQVRQRLRNRAGDAHRNVRTEILAVLGGEKGADPSDRAWAIDQAKKDLATRERESITWAIDTLGRIGGDEAIAVLIDTLLATWPRDLEGPARGRATKVLGKIGGTVAIIPLLATLVDPRWRHTETLRAIANCLLPSEGATEVVAELQHLAKEPGSERDFRFGLVRMIGQVLGYVGQTPPGTE